MCWNYQNRCKILIKAQILPLRFSRHLQGHFFFRKLSLKHAFGNSNTKLKLLVILVIIFIIWFWTSRLNGINVIDEHGSARSTIWIWKIGKFWFRNSHWRWSLKEDIHKKNRKNHQKTSVLESVFYRKKTPK